MQRVGHDYLGFEHFNEAALISRDGWKIVRPGENVPWELYDLNSDRTERHNVARQHPQRVTEWLKIMNRGSNDAWCFLNQNIER